LALRIRCLPPGGSSWYGGNPKLNLAPPPHRSPFLIPRLEIFYMVFSKPFTSALLFSLQPTICSPSKPLVMEFSPIMNPSQQCYFYLRCSPGTQVFLYGHRLDVRFYGGFPFPRSLSFASVLSRWITHLTPSSVETETVLRFSSPRMSACICSFCD